MLIERQLDFDSNLQIQIDQLAPLAYQDHTRITVIDESGKVLADSEEITNEDHSTRKEIINAKNEKIGYASRYSNTLKQNLLYVAYYHNHHIIRIAIPYSGLFDNAKILFPPILFSSIVSFIIALALSYHLSKKLTKPIVEINNDINRINIGKEIKLKQYDINEYNIIDDAIYHLYNDITITMNRLKEEKLKINRILDQMNEGFVLLDNELRILMINQKAKQLINVNIEYNVSIKEYVFDKKIIEALEHVSTIPVIIESKIEREIYACYISKVEYGVTMLYVNVTAERNAMEIRQEFFSNVSHELKTPMTSIKGYSELLQTGMIPKDAQQKIYQKIQQEVNSMSDLINDILMISRLENKDVDEPKVLINLKSVIEEVLGSLAVEMHNKDISIEVSCDDISYLSNHQHIHQLFNNLISNAVKYNKEHGNIWVNCYYQDQNLVITVIDDGVGIALSNQSRIFERFYRVDKSRDKNRGGTGLGLSIVKHIVQYYKGCIFVDSQLDQGSKFTIILPIDYK